MTHTRVNYFLLLWVLRGLSVQAETAKFDSVETDQAGTAYVKAAAAPVAATPWRSFVDPTVAAVAKVPQITRLTRFLDRLRENLTDAQILRMKVRMRAMWKKETTLFNHFNELRWQSDNKRPLDKEELESLQEELRNMDGFQKTLSSDFETVLSKFAKVREVKFVKGRILSDYAEKEMENFVQFLYDKAIVEESIRHLVYYVEFDGEPYTFFAHGGKRLGVRYGHSDKDLPNSSDRITAIGKDRTSKAVKLVLSEILKGEPAIGGKRVAFEDLEFEVVQIDSSGFNTDSYRFEQIKVRDPKTGEYSALDDFIYQYFWTTNHKNDLKGQGEIFQIFRNIKLPIPASARRKPPADED